MSGDDQGAEPIGVSLTDVTEEPWVPLHDLAVKSYYSGEIAVGRWACETLLSLPDLPKGIRSRTRCNQIFYSPLLEDLTPSVQTKPILFEVPPLFSRFNPSIAADGEGFRLVIRSADFISGMTDPFDHPVSSDGTFHEANYLVLMDGDLEVRRAELVHAPPELEEIADRPDAVRAITDCRLFSWRDQWYVSGTLFDDQREVPPAMGLLRLEDANLYDLVILSDREAGIPEKNWMPVVHGGDLLFVYSVSPTVIMRYSADGVTERATHTGPHVLRDYRGGSQGVEVDDGYLFVIHETVYRDNGTRAYPHRFILMDRDFHITHTTTPFFFLHRFKQFCCGMTRRAEQLVISFGFMNREAFVARVPLGEVLAILRPVHG